MESILIKWSLLLLLCSSAIASTDDIEQGRHLYLNAGGYGCAVCHGLVAHGAGQAGGAIRGASRAELDKSLNENIPMIPLAETLTETDRQQLIHYLQSLVQLPLIQFNYEISGWTVDSESFTKGQTVELVLYNGSFETQRLDLTSIDLGVLELAPLTTTTQRWHATADELPSLNNVEFLQADP